MDINNQTPTGERREYSGVKGFPAGDQEKFEWF